MVFRLRWAAAACVACVLGMTGGVMAAEGQAALGPALEQGQKATGKVLKGELLRRCKKLDEEIFKLNFRLEVLQQTMVVWDRQLVSLNAEIDATQATLDLTDTEAVARSNRVIDRQNEVVAERAVLLPEHNELVARINPRVDEFNEKCAEITYYRQEWLDTKVVLDPDLMPPATVF